MFATRINSYTLQGEIYIIDHEYQRGKPVCQAIKGMLRLNFKDKHLKLRGEIPGVQFKDVVVYFLPDIQTTSGTFPPATCT